jgi:hypothetical protein
MAGAVAYRETHAAGNRANSATYFGYWSGVHRNPRPAKPGELRWYTTDDQSSCPRYSSTDSER